MSVAILVPLSAHGEEVATTPTQTKQMLALTPTETAPASAPIATTPTSAPGSAPAVILPPLDELNSFDAPRNYLSGKWVNFVTHIDGFFGNDRNYQETNDSVVQIDISRVMGYGGLRNFVFQGKAKIHLPRAEKSLHLLIESDPDKNTVVAPTQAKIVQPVTNTTPVSYGAGLRYEKAEEKHWHFSTDGGLKFQGLNTAPFARMRGSYEIPLKRWRLNAAETFFWFNTTGAGETTQVDFERPLSSSLIFFTPPAVDPLIFRATSVSTWLNNTQRFDLRQDFAVFQTINERSAIVYQASAIGVSNPALQAQVSDYVVLMLYRYRLHREWTYLDVGPQLHFPRERNFRASGTLSVRLEMLFDSSR